MDISIKEVMAVRSKRLLERRSKKRKVGKNSNNVAREVSKLMTSDMKEKIDKGLINQNDPLRLFLWGPETKQLLTVKEEKDLFVQIQVCLLQMLFCEFQNYLCGLKKYSDVC